MKLRFKDKINYILLCGVVYPLSLLPLRVLYLFADVTAWLARCVVHYRRGTVRRNIEEAYPDRDTKELRRIEKGILSLAGRLRRGDSEAPDHVRAHHQAPPCGGESGAGEPRAGTGPQRHPVLGSLLQLGVGVVIARSFP